MNVATSLEGYSCHHASRNNNKVAHILARLRVTVSEVSIWIKEVPSSAEHIVVSKLISA